MRKALGEPKLWPMVPVDRMNEQEARGLRGLLFDLDDTLLDEGRLTLEAHAALEKLHDAGLLLMAVTGRPAGWGAVLARLWPVRAVVTENGAIAVYREGRAVHLLDPVSAEERARRNHRLGEFVQAVEEHFPELQPASEWSLRVSDRTFDIGETRAVPDDVVEGARAFARDRGVRTTRSSVHLHVTLDGDDKASGAVRALRVLCGIDPTVARASFAFIGDSENDSACFGAFSTTFAVANFRGKPTVPPRYVTRQERGAGFAEAAEVIVDRRTR